MSRFEQPDPCLCHTLAESEVFRHGTNEDPGGPTAARFAARIAGGSTGEPLGPRATARVCGTGVAHPGHAHRAAAGPTRLAGGNAPVRRGKTAACYDAGIDQEQFYFVWIPAKEAGVQSVASSLPITADPFPQEPTPGTILASGAPEAFESVPFDESRWNAWVNQGRLADTAFKEKMRILAMLGAMGAVGAGTVWVFLG
jgi:hypothetical protein